MSGIVDSVIRDELHTDDITEGAIVRLERSEDQNLLPPPTRTGGVQARTTTDSMYGVNRRTAAPLKSGVNFSYNSLVCGSGLDETALPDFLREKYLKPTEKLIKDRRSFFAKKMAAASKRVMGGGGGVLPPKFNKG